MPRTSPRLRAAQRNKEQVEEDLEEEEEEDLEEEEEDALQDDDEEEPEPNDDQAENETAAATKRPLQKLQKPQSSQLKLTATTKPTKRSTPSTILQASFLPQNQHDLTHRLPQLWQTLLTVDTTMDDPTAQYPGLPALAWQLPQYWTTNNKTSPHDRKTIRLYSMACALEIICWYAPEVPYDDATLLQFFQQLVPQLANISNHCQPDAETTRTVTSTETSTKTNTTHKKLPPSTSQSQQHSRVYRRMLHQMATVKVAALLTDPAMEEAQEMGPYQEVLVDLVHTLLQGLRPNHPTPLVETVYQTLTVIWDEYHPAGLSVPIPVLEQVLLALGSGPTVPQLVVETNQIANANAKNTSQKSSFSSKSSTTPPTIRHVPNPTYKVALQLLQLPSSAAPVAQWINGLLTQDPRCTDRSSIALSYQVPPLDNHHNNKNKPLELSDVHLYRIVIHLSHIPAIWTTVAGTWAQGLESPHEPMRHAVVYGWGQYLRLPSSSSSSSSSSSPHDAITLSSWIPRSEDPSPTIRLTWVQTAIPLFLSWTHRPNPKNTTKHNDLLYHRLNQALQGAVQYDSHKPVRLWCLHELCDAEFAKGNLPLDLVRALASRIAAKDAQERKNAVTGLAQIYSKHGIRPTWNPDDVHERYSWIPAMILEALATYTDEMDGTMRNRLYQIWDDVFLSRCTDQPHKAQGLVALMQSLPDPEPVVSLLRSRQKLQSLLQNYLQARTESKSSSFPALEALAAALPHHSNTADFLHDLHKAKDQHIFRILATIADPCHKPQARQRALDDLVQRVQTQVSGSNKGKSKGSIADAAAQWTKQLVRRVAMGPSVNVGMVQECIALATSSAAQDEDDDEEEEDCQWIDECQAICETLHSVLQVFPSLAAQSFGDLFDLYGTVVDVQAQQTKKTSSLSSLATRLSQIVALVADSGKVDLSKKEAKEVESKLVEIATSGKGRPTQSRHAMLTLASLWGRSQPKLFEKLWKTLSSKRLEWNKPEKLICTLASLSALLEKLSMDPSQLEETVTFVLETVLYDKGSDDAGDDDDEMSIDGSDDEEEKGGKTGKKRKSQKKTPKKRSQNAGAHKTPQRSTNLLEDESISTTTRRLCAGMEFLAAYARAAAASGKFDPAKINSIMEALLQLIRDKGSPLASRDQQACRSRQDRAALRQCAGVCLLRLCEGQSMTAKQMTPSQWQIFSEIFLDEEKSVREAVISELALFLRGDGSYGKNVVPSLRFVAFMTLCVDDSLDHGLANGSAANIGKMNLTLKNAAKECIVKLRQASESFYRQCQAQGEEAERKFETVFKMSLMPEYVVPFAVHLLAHRPETPSGKDVDSSDNSSSSRVLRKRLKNLFEPLIHSLGDSADNISFLMQIIDLLGQNFMPIDASVLRGRPNQDRQKVLRQKLQAVCKEARQLLLSFVKKDINLEPYPGTVRIPQKYFTRAATSKNKVMAKPLPPEFTPPTKDIKTVLADRMNSGSSRKSRVHFSPDVKERARSSHRPMSTVQSETPDEEFPMSPIAHSKSPSEKAGSSQESSAASDEVSQSKLTTAEATSKTKSGTPSQKSPRRTFSKKKSPATSTGSDPTLGMTPPSALRAPTMRSTQETQTDKAPSPNLPNKRRSPRRQADSPGSNVSKAASFFVVDEFSATQQDENEEEGFKTTSETQSTPEPSEPSPEKPAIYGSRKRDIPKDIQIVKAQKKQKKSVTTTTTTKSTKVVPDEENRPLRRNLRRSARAS